jgi:hypothetical protein
MREQDRHEHLEVPCPDHFVGSETLTCEACGWDAATRSYRVETWEHLHEEHEDVERRIVAHDRDEADTCERGTSGCSIAHAAEQVEGTCETW